MGSIDSNSSFRRRNDEHQVQRHPKIHDDGYPQGAVASVTSKHSDDNYRISMDDDIRARIDGARRNRDMLFQDHSPRIAKLGIFSTGCLLVNRMIGTGIFETPKTIWMSTETTAGALFMWVLGGLISYAGMAVYLELGLTIPRYLVRGRWRSVPRSGGEKNYVGYPSYPRASS